MAEEIIKNAGQDELGRYGDLMAKWWPWLTAGLALSSALGVYAYFLVNLRILAVYVMSVEDYIAIFLMGAIFVSGILLLSTVGMWVVSHLFRYLFYIVKYFGFRIFNFRNENGYIIISQKISSIMVMIVMVFFVSMTLISLINFSHENNFSLEFNRYISSIFSVIWISFRGILKQEIKDNITGNVGILFLISWMMILIFTFFKTSEWKYQNFLSQRMFRAWVLIGPAVCSYFYLDNLHLHNYQVNFRAEQGQTTVCPKNELVWSGSKAVVVRCTDGGQSSGAKPFILANPQSVQLVVTPDNPASFWATLWPFVMPTVDSKPPEVNILEKSKGRQNSPKGDYKTALPKDTKTGDKDISPKKESK